MPWNISCHTFRATGITEYLRNSGTVEKAAQIAAREHQDHSALQFSQ
jgi:hypothetical protein